MILVYINEVQMYPDVASWINVLLKGRYHGARIDIKDTHSTDLNEFIARHGLQDYFSDDRWQTYEIRVDLTAFIISRYTKGLVFVECKTTNISLLNVSQLLGYSRVALPLSSYLVSSKGIGASVLSLITKYGRSDVLEYQWSKGQMARSIVIGKWDGNRKGIDPNSVLPPGASGEI